MVTVSKTAQARELWFKRQDSQVESSDRTPDQPHSSWDTTANCCKSVFTFFTTLAQSRCWANLCIMSVSCFFTQPQTCSEEPDR
eukprot:s1469_g7.t1